MADVSEIPVSWPGPRGYEKTLTSEMAVLERLAAWKKTLGVPMSGGRANPDNDMWFMLNDAEEVINGLRSYARKLEKRND